MKFLNHYTFSLDFISSVQDLEAATGGILQKQVFLQISQNSQETPTLKFLFFNKAAGLHAYNFIKKETSPQMLSC